MKIKVLMLATTLLLLTACDTESSKRAVKDMESSKNGLNRILTVYSADGKEIKSWEGKFDIEISEDGKVKFDLNDKRVIIYNAPVVCEEK